MSTSKQHARARLYHRTLAIIEGQARELDAAIVGAGLSDVDAATIVRLAFCQYAADAGIAAELPGVMGDPQAAPSRKARARYLPGARRASRSKKRGA